MSWHDAADEDLNHLRSRRTFSSSSLSSNKTTGTTASDLEQSNIVAMGTSESQRVAHYLEHVPLPPAAYMFSYGQRQKQRLFFEQFLATPLQRQLYSMIDLYQMKIIAVRKCRQVSNRSIFINLYVSFSFLNTCSFSAR